MSTIFEILQFLENETVTSRKIRQRKIFYLSKGFVIRYPRPLDRPDMAQLITVKPHGVWARRARRN